MTKPLPQKEEPTDIGSVIFFAVAIGSFLIGLWLSNHLFLIYHYGWKRCSAESLTFVQMPKAKPWVVSNGDRLDMGFSHFLLTSAIWIPVFSVVFALVVRLVGRDRMFISKR